MEGMFIMQEENSSLFDKLSDDDIGVILQQLEEFESFYPIYKSILEK